MHRAVVVQAEMPRRGLSELFVSHKSVQHAVIVLDNPFINNCLLSMLLCLQLLVRAARIYMYKSMLQQPICGRTVTQSSLERFGFCRTIKTC